ncbi:MAG: DUF4350 domain-containing protein, partial [Actinomycetota bacterium]|nr:DUF4350 domain-containing protein [Actinomycetota bacterium]
MKMRSPWAVVGFVAVAIVTANLALRELDQATRSPGGPTSSSFATAPEGAAAYAELLRRFDRPVVQLREAPSDAELDPGATLVLLDVRPVPSEDARAIEQFVRAGGRLLHAGRDPGWLRSLDDAVPRWEPTSVGRATVSPAADDLGGVRSVVADDVGLWETTEGVLLDTPDGALAIERPVGRGEAVLLSTASPLQNRLLAEADNAAFALAAAGPAGQPAIFAESFHGYGAATGLEAIPSAWWWGFGGLCLAALSFAFARGRRLGPPELPDRELPPARVEFADALAVQLAKTRPRSDGVRVARRLIRARLTRELRLPVDAGDDAIRAAADSRGFEPELIE